ncbi:protocadherin alpha-2-like [Trichomycterus rosablanca]|uniref:protocadherin alpha-2-like n=1 Tax=Trichomycterus rosablanca TaxID=2290929 RepID=UPI002F350AD1
MEQRRHASWQMKLLLTALSLLCWKSIFAQIRYSVLEEQEDGTVVGNIAKDLGVDHRTVKERKFRVVSATVEPPFELNQTDGVLYTNGKIDREKEVSDHSLFGLERYTGQIRTLRSFTETDDANHKLVILVKDNGKVSLSVTASVIIKIVDPKEAFAVLDVKGTTKEEEENNITFYLIITLGSVSVLFVLSICVLIIMQCSKFTDYSSKYVQDTTFDGTLCHSIQYRSGDKRYMLVGPRMSIGSTVVPGSNGNTLVVPDRRRRGSEEPLVE